MNRELIESTLRSVFGAVPWFGTALNEALFEYRGRVKQRRFEAFILRLATDLSGLRESAVSREYLSSDDFVDFAEALLLRVLRTRSEERISRFAKIFVSEIQAPSNPDFMEHFLDLALQLQEAQVAILREYYRAWAERGRLYHPRSDSRDEPFRTSEHYGLGDDLYRAFLQDLIGRGLMYDTGAGRIGTGPLVFVELTEIGTRFVEFLREGQNT